jgi:serine/threonine-protein kinase
MEFVDGEDISSLLRRLGRLPGEKALAVAHEICAGLLAAHEMNVIHRDLKPGNVMLDGRGRAKITDFGLAVAEQASAGEGTAGTPAYMAPEQLAGGPASRQSDIYALGLVLYEVFTGERAFSATSLGELIERQRALDCRPPSEIVHAIDAQVERVILGCIAPDPGERPPSVAEVIRQLPHYDPLAAALAAGETPAPEMVAAAGERGGLSRAVAWSVLLAFFVGLFAYAAFSPATMLYERFPGIKSPLVLKERVAAILAATGRSADNGDSVFEYSRFGSQLPDEAAPGLEIVPLGFFYRQSPEPLRAGWSALTILLVAWLAWQMWFSMQRAA